MNYRRGFRRAYIVCSVLWIVLAVVLSVLGRPKPRGEGFVVDKRLVDLGKMISDGMAGKIVHPREFAAAIKAINPLPADKRTWTDGQVIRDFAATNPHLGLDKWLFDLSDQDAAQASTPASSAGAKPPQPLSENSGRYWGTRFAVTLIPPAIGYFILFVVAPWVYRGFVSKEHSIKQ
jgi:hypothetical protein